MSDVQTLEPDPAWMVTCQEDGCGKEFRRKSLAGPKPKRCDDCKLKVKRANIDALRASQLQKPHYEPEPNTGITQPVDPEPEIVAKVEPSWLDDEEAQELLAERRRQELGLDDEAVGDEPDQRDDLALTAETYKAARPPLPPETFTVAAEPDSPVLPEGFTQHHVAEPKPQRATSLDKAEVCIVPVCMVSDPTHVELFCNSHWQLISLEVRGVLLGAPRGSAPFDQAVQRALRQLTE